MSNPSVALFDPDLADPARTAKCERLLDLAPEPVLWAMEQTRRSLVAHENERWHERPSRRRARELDRLIEQEVGNLCQAIKKLMSAADSMPPA